MTLLPIPDGRGIWRLTLHERAFTSGAGTSWQQTILAELSHARGRQLTQALNKPASLTFTLDGHDPVAALVVELQTDVVAWRWDSVAGRDVPYFHGIVGHSEDQLSEQDHVVTFTCLDYFAVLNRRYLTRPLTYTNVDQDAIVNGLLNAAITMVPSGSSPANFSPGSYLPLALGTYNADSTNRAYQGTVSRVRQYTAQSSIGQMIDDLAHVIGGFDYDVRPGWRPPASNASIDVLRVFYPQQGVTLSDPVLEYGGDAGIATVTRTVDSGSYANYLRVVGDSTDASAPPPYGEAFNGDANNVGVVPVGLWQDIDSASDVTDQPTLVQKAQGDLNVSGVLEPSYTLGLRPGAYREGLFNMGDSVPVVIRSGRLVVNTTQRIVGMQFSIGDDGQEDVALTVGRSPTSLVDLLAGTAADVDALARR